MAPKPKKQKLQELKMERRVGLYTSDPNKAYLGIFKAPKDQQKVFRKNITSQIRKTRKGG